VHVNIQMRSGGDKTRGKKYTQGRLSIAHTFILSSALMDCV